MNNVLSNGFIEIAGFRLNYSIEGYGIPILVVGSSIYYKRTFSTAVKKQFRFIFVDHRGFVPPPVENLTTDSFELAVLINDIETIRSFFDLENFIIAGHSGHAFMALEYAKKYPQHVLAVLMIAVTPDYSADTHKIADLFFESEASANRKEQFQSNMEQLPAQIAAHPGKRFVSYCLAAGPKSWYDYNFDASHLWADVYTNMHMIDYVWGDVFRNIDIKKGLSSLHKPVLLALGRYDFLTGPVNLWDEVKLHFADLTIKIFEKSAHCPQYEEEEPFDRELLQWVTGIEISQVPVQSAESFKAPPAKNHN